MAASLGFPLLRRSLSPSLCVVALAACSPVALGEVATPPAKIANAAFEMPSLAPPAVGARSLQIISPTLVELMGVIAGPSNNPPDGEMAPIPVPSIVPTEFTVTVDGVKVDLTGVGFRRRVVYAPLKKRDLRVGHFVVLRLAQPLADNKRVTVAYSGKLPWLTGPSLNATMSPTRLGPAIHVNHVGYMPDSAKSAFVGYYAGTLQEMPPPESAEFSVVNVRNGDVVHRGKLTPRPDRGMARPWYRKVVEANFTDLKTPGEYRLVVPGHGASYPFLIHEGVAAAFARTYALGLYHQRCGAENALPFTRFTHGPCHAAHAEIPGVPFRSLKGLEEAAEDADLFPFVRRGKVDVSGGHHDAGDYSKYTTNSANLIHSLMFAVDSLKGVAALDNLGLPESGDGKSDLLQIAKWEADFLAKMQDEDGGFYFLVYPKNRRYEDDVLPDKGDPQIVWPKNSAATAAATAALAQCASSKEFKRHFPEDAKRYLEIAQRGWAFLKKAEERFGAGKAYRKFTHYGDAFADADELAWAATELFLATGDARFEEEMRKRLEPRSPKQRRHNWRRLTEAYGNATRSYAFAAVSGRLDAAKLDRLLLKQCEDEVVACAEDWARAIRDSAYLVSYPEQMKVQAAGGWYFASDYAFDFASASQLEYPPKADRREAFRNAAYSNLNYDAGGNPLNLSFITGLGWKRPLEIVHQYAQNDHRLIPISGIPQGSIQDGFGWLWKYKGELGAYSHPLDGDKLMPYPILDRWGDTFNLPTEFVVVNQGRALAVAAWLMAQSPLRDQPWKAATADIAGATGAVKAGKPLKLELTLPKDLNPADARIVWEGKDQPPAFGTTFSFTPKESGDQWVEAEAQWPDGRRVFAVKKFNASR